MPILPQTPSNPLSIAFQFGAQDAIAGAAFAPEAIFVRRCDQIQFAFGFESIAGVSEITAQFTGSELPKPVQVAHKRRDGGEYLRWTDLAADKELKASARHDKRIAKMIAMTAAFGLPGDIIFMAA